MKATFFFLSLLIILSFIAQAQAQSQPAMVLQQTQDIISIVYKDIPKQITLMPNGFQTGQITGCQIWGVNVTNRISTSYISMKITGDLVKQGLSISRGANCPDWPLKGYIDGTVELQMDKTFWTQTLVNGVILIVASFGPINITDVNPPELAVTPVFLGNGIVVPVRYNAFKNITVFEIKTNPLIEIISLFANNNWVLFEAQEMIGWARIQMWQWQPEFNLAPSKNMLVFVNKGQHRVASLQQKATTWSSLKKGVD